MNEGDRSVEAFEASSTRRRERARAERAQREKNQTHLALNVHEERVRRLHQTLELVLGGFQLRGRVQQINVLSEHLRWWRRRASRGQYARRSRASDENRFFRKSPTASALPPRPSCRYRRDRPVSTKGARARVTRDGWRVRLLPTPARATPARDVTARHRSRSHQTPSRRVTHHDSTFGVSERRRARRRRPPRRRLSLSLARPRRPTECPITYHTPQRFAPYSITEEWPRVGDNAHYGESIVHVCFPPYEKEAENTPSPPSSRACTPSPSRFRGGRCERAPHFADATRRVNRHGWCVKRAR